MPKGEITISWQEKAAAVARIDRALRAWRKREDARAMRETMDRAVTHPRAEGRA